MTTLIKFCAKDDNQSKNDSYGERIIIAESQGN